MDLNISEGSATFQFNKYLFNSRVQEVNETIEDFVKDLIRLGSSINAQESQIVDRFIAGLSNDNARMGILNHSETNLQMALNLAKENEHETVLYTEHVPVTSVGGAPSGNILDSYQVIVMPSQDLPPGSALEGSVESSKHILSTTAEDFNQAKFPTDPNEGNLNYSKLVLVNSFAKKNAEKRDSRSQLMCSRCSFHCLTPVLMKIHQKTFHADFKFVDESSCKQCNVSFLTKAALETHLVMIHNHSKEDIVKQRIDNILGIDTMRDTEDENLKSNIDPLFPLNLRNLQDCICPECLFKAPSIDVLQKHMQKFHDDSKKFRCMLCNSIFNTKGGLTRHTLREHKGHKIFMCDTCGKKFQTDKTLSAHVKVVHNNMKPFACTQCDYKAGQKASLIAHITSIHENNRPYVCELCGYKTASPSTLSAHKRMVHERQRPFVCETCGRKFAAKAGMENHILLIHEKAMPFTCDQCNKRFKRKADLINHVRCAHEGQYYSCHICHNQFHSQRNLERHISVVHEQKKSYECTFCGLSFARKERLKQHMATDGVHGDITIVKDESDHPGEQNTGTVQRYTIQVQTFSDQHGEAIQTHQIQINE